MSIGNEIKIIGLKDIPLVKKGDNIPAIIISGLQKSRLSLENGDILVIAQSIVSKSNDRTKNLNDVISSKRALKISSDISPKAKNQGLPMKEPKLIQLILDESEEIIKSEHVLITETKHGFVCADAGIDKSNVEGNNIVTLLPESPDKEAEKIRKELSNIEKKEIAVIISDSFGRAFRVGAIGVAIGVSGINPILDMRGKKDLFGYELQSTIIGQADSLASAAQLIMGEANEGIPIVLIRGYKFEFNDKVTINPILRNKDIDLFRESESKKFIKVLKNRRSYKFFFDNKDVERKIIEECIEIARWAPSAHNGQFWRYVILEKDNLRNKLIVKMNEKLKSDLIKDGKSEEFIMQKINKTKNRFLNAPKLILLCLDTTNLERYQDVERTQNEFILGIQSISSSATYLLLAFEVKKLAACWYCAPLFAKNIIKEVLNLPESYIPMAFFTVGHPLKTSPPPPRLGLPNILFETNI